MFTSKTKKSLKIMSHCLNLSTGTNQPKWALAEDSPFDSSECRELITFLYITLRDKISEELEPCLQII